MVILPHLSEKTSRTRIVGIQSLPMTRASGDYRLQCDLPALHHHEARRLRRDRSWARTTVPTSPGLIRSHGAQALHQIFRRREPSPSGAAITLLCADAALYGLLARLGDLPLTHSALVVLAIAGATIVGSLLLSIAAYRLSPWHPLARIPGPWDYKLTKLRVAYSAWHGNHYKNVKKLHDKYGPVVRVGAFTTLPWVPQSIAS